MYYEPYEQKILKLARIRDKIYKLRFLILAVFLVVTGTIVGLVAAKGAFFEGVSIEVSYVYGEEITPKASAFMSKTSYEYYDGTEWSEEKPFMP